jgi:integrase
MRGHIRKRGSTWAVVYDEGPDDEGKRRQRWRGGYRTRKEAQAALNEALARLDRGDYITPERLTFGEFVRERWLPVIAGERRRTTLASYERHLRRHVLPEIGGLPLQRLDASRLNRLYIDLTARGLSKNTVRVIAAVVSAALKDATRWKLVPSNVARDADPPRPERRRGRTWSARETATFLDSVRDDRLFALWRFLAVTGARRGEGLGLTWLALDLEAGRASISQALVPVGSELVLTEPKTDAGRRLLPLDTGTVAALHEHRQRQLAERALLGDAYEDHDLVFARPDGRPLSPPAVSAAFLVRARHAGLPPIRLHDLRHGVATMLLREQVHPEIVRRRLGHSSIAVTLGTYSHEAPELEQAAADGVAALIDTRLFADR